jgi:hypothetical protein
MEISHDGGEIELVADTVIDGRPLTRQSDVSTDNGDVSFDIGEAEDACDYLFYSDDTTAKDIALTNLIRPLLHCQ